MTGTSGITFNVIFIRNSVRWLCAFLHSHITRASTVCFRLVSNGCRPSEARMLRELADRYDQLDFLEISRRKVLPHGIVLDELLKRERAPVFAFMDSDCFATGAWFCELAPILRHADAVFSGPPLWMGNASCSLPTGSQLMTGEYDQLENGSCLGSSYFAVYNSKVISDNIRETGLTLKGYFWTEIPSHIRAELVRADRKARWYETGKLLNILLDLRGYRCRTVCLPHLWHIGDMSCSIAHRVRRRLVRLLDACGLSEPMRSFLHQTRLRKDPLWHTSVEDRQRYRESARRRHSVSRQFLELLRHLEGRGPCLPALKHANGALVAEVASAEHHVRKLHEEWLASAAEGGR